MARKDLQSIVEAGQDIIDSRDVIARISELEDDESDLVGELEKAQAMEDDGSDAEDREIAIAEAQEAIDEWRADEGKELARLRKLVEDIDSVSGDSARDGAALIEDSYFETYAQELAEDIGAINRDAQWPNTCIDWEEAARQLRQDYNSIDYNGFEYWVRS
jgi:hypothetical protein